MAAEIKVLSSIATREAYNDLLPEFERVSGQKVIDNLGGHRGHHEADGGGWRGPRPGHHLQQRTRRLDQAGQDRGGQPRRSRQVRNRRRGEARVRRSPISVRPRRSRARCLPPSRSAIPLGPAGSTWATWSSAWGSLSRSKPNSAAFPPVAPSAPSWRPATARSASSRSASSCTFKGIDYAGPLPADIQRVTIFSSGIQSGAENAAGAKALQQFLTTPAAAAVMRKHGLETS